MSRFVLFTLIFWLTFQVQANDSFFCPPKNGIEVGKRTVSREEAIAIARKKGYYETGKGWNEPIVQQNDSLQQWVIICQRYTTTRRGKCKRTNGCTLSEKKTIVIDLYSGKVIDKTRKRKKYPNYE